MKGLRRGRKTVLALAAVFFCLILHQAPLAATVRFSATIGRTRLLVGETCQIGFHNTQHITYRFKSSNPKVAKVTRKEGLITARKSGKTTLTITGIWKKGGKKKVWKRQAVIQVSTCKLSAKAITLRQGKSKKLSVKKLKVKRKITWYSETPEICAVSASGKVSALRTGQGIVCARVGDTFVRRCKVKVTVTTLNSSSMQLLVNPTHTYGAVDIAVEMQKTVNSRASVHLSVVNPALGHLTGSIYYADAYGTNTVKAYCNGYEKKYVIVQKVWSGHRGYSDMYPENTIDAFDGAGLAGAAAIETDIRVTSDLVPVCMHDAKLANMTNSASDAVVEDMTFEEVRALQINNGNNLSRLVHRYVPTFEEYLQVCSKYRMLALIDLKSIGLTAQKRKVVVSEMLRLLNKYGMKDRCILLGGSAGRLKGFRDAAEGEADSIPIAAVGTIWPELKAMNLPNSYSSYSVTPFGHISGQDYSPLVGRKNRAVDSYHTRVK